MHAKWILSSKSDAPVPEGNLRRHIRVLGGGGGSIGTLVQQTAVTLNAREVLRALVHQSWT